ncbi:MAG: hypothetical protein WCR07_11480 [Verrucomicrobiota bacterium]|jgi:hypothetical protein
MSLPTFSTQGSLFPKSDRYRLFATLVFPRIVAARAQIEAAYSLGSGRAAIETVVLLGVCVSAGGEYTENQRFEMHMGRED